MDESNMCKKLSKQQSDDDFDHTATESINDDPAIVMQEACTKADFKLTTSIQALKEKVDLAGKMFNISDSICDGIDGADSAVNDDSEDFLYESSDTETDRNW